MATITQGMLEAILPLAIKWVENKQTTILKLGQELTEEQKKDAVLAGVQQPGKIRLLYMPEIPRPDDGLLMLSNDMVHLVTPDNTGLALYYGIYIRESCRNDRETHVHEFVHVSQYEKLGGIAPFLSRYLLECVQYGYPQAPLEQEAIENTRLICDK